MEFVLRSTLANGVDFARGRAPFSEHRQHWEAHRADHTPVAIDPMEDPTDSALAIFATREAAEHFARSDPFVTGGIVCRPPRRDRLAARRSSNRSCSVIQAAALNAADACD